MCVPRRSRHRTTVAGALTALVWLVGCTTATSVESPATLATPSAASTAAMVEPEQDLVVDRHHFIAQCGGRGPSVVLVSGYGSAMDFWGDLPTRLGATTRTCMYDRLGTGRSSSPPAIQTFEDIADDLDGVISALRLPRPVVVVAHSLGGPVAVTWAAHHPTDARALVLLDPTPPGWHAAQKSLTPPPDPSDIELTAMMEDDRGFDDPVTNLEALDPTSWTAYDRISAVDVPLRVLVAEVPPRLPAALDAPKFEAAWKAGQRRLAGLSRDSHIVTATGADHIIWLWRADLVLLTVNDAIAQHRTSQPATVVARR